MSDYDDASSDYDYDDWLYVEDTYLAADDLAEHAVNSPPPMTYADEDAIEEWDRFEYYCDLEYGSDGYEDEADVRTAAGRKGSTPQTGKKRKRGAGTGAQQVKRRRLQNEWRRSESPESRRRSLSPLPTVLWRSLADRKPVPRMLDSNQAVAYALLPNWRDIVDDSGWATAQLHNSHSDLKILNESSVPNASGHDHAASQDIQSPTPVAASPHPQIAHESLDPAAETEDAATLGDTEVGEVDVAALMAILQNRLSDAGGPLSGMDASKLLEYAMRMINEEGTAEDIAGELADDMLDQVDEEESSSNELMSWLSQQGASGEKANTSEANSANHDLNKNTLPALPLRRTQPSTLQSSKDLNKGLDMKMSPRKRRASPDVEDGIAEFTDNPSPSKTRRTTKLYDAPTTAKRTLKGQQ